MDTVRTGGGAGIEVASSTGTGEGAGGGTEGGDTGVVATETGVGLSGG